MPFRFDLRHLEHLLPPSPPLAGRWWAYRCEDCHDVTLLDMRIDRLPLVPRLRLSGLAAPRCRHCGSERLQRDGLVVS